MKNLLKIVCAIALIAPSLRLEAANVTFPFQTIQGAPQSPQITITAGDGGIFTVGTNAVFGSLTITLTNGFAEVTNLQPILYFVQVQGLSERYRMPVPNDTNTYSWTQLVTNGLNPASLVTAFMLTNDPRAVDLTNGANIFAALEFTGAFAGDGSGLSNLWFLGLTNTNATVVFHGSFTIKDSAGFSRLNFADNYSGLLSPAGVGVFAANQFQAIISDPVTATSILLITTTNTQILNDVTLATNLTVPTIRLTGAPVDGYTVIMDALGDLIPTNFPSGGGGSGTVTSVSGPSGFLTWASSTTTPAATLNSQAAGSIFGNGTGGTAAPGASTNGTYTANTINVQNASFGGISSGSVYTTIARTSDIAISASDISEPDNGNFDLNTSGTATFSLSVTAPWIIFPNSSTTPTGSQVGSGGTILWSSNGVFYASVSPDGSTVNTTLLAQ